MYSLSIPCDEGKPSFFIPDAATDLCSWTFPWPNEHKTDFNITVCETMQLASPQARGLWLCWSHGEHSLRSATPGNTNRLQRGNTFTGTDDCREAVNIVTDKEKGVQDELKQTMAQACWHPFHVPFQMHLVLSAVMGENM